MKFISKNANYRVVLRSGIPGNRNLGTQAIPGLYIKFEGGMAEVKGQEAIELLKQHPAFLNGDVILAQEDGVDPFLASRKNIEPEHTMVNVEYGHVGKNINPKPLVNLSDDQMRAVKNMASELAINMVKEMLPKAVEDEIIRQNKAKTSSIGSEKITKPVSNYPSKDPRLTAPEPLEDDRQFPDDSSDDNTDLRNIVKQEVKTGGEEIGDTDVEITNVSTNTIVTEVIPAIKKKTGRPPKTTQE